MPLLRTTAIMPISWSTESNLGQSPQNFFLLKTIYQKTTIAWFPIEIRCSITYSKLYFVKSSDFKKDARKFDQDLIEEV